jgi:hypothetical protein
MMNNGITFDEENKKVYAVNVMERRVRVYSLIRNESVGEEISLKYVEDINTIYALDNVEFDKSTGIITAGVIGRLADHLAITGNLEKKHSLEGVGKRWGGSLQIDTRNGNKVEILVIQNDMLHGIASAVKVNNTVFHSSWVDEGVLVCDIKK